MLDLNLENSNLNVPSRKMSVSAKVLINYQISDQH